MRVLHVTPTFVPAYRYGGPIETVLRLCQSLQAAGAEVAVATTAADGRKDLDVPLQRWVDVEGLQVQYFPRSLPIEYAPSRALWNFLGEHASDYDLVHITSTFSFPSLVAGMAARSAGVPYVVSPHGSLQRWSLHQKRWKKVPYWIALERAHLMGAAGIHATAELEAAEIGDAIPHPDIFIVPNGLEPVAVPDVPRHPRRIVFLGRIHPKKGFDVLIPALSRVTQALPEVETLVAGPDDDGEWRRVEALLDRARPRPNVRYLGPVYGDKRFELLASAAAFVLPSHSENFGMTVVEAMACRTPVVVSRNCPWRSVEERGAGAWVASSRSFPIARSRREWARQAPSSRHPSHGRGSADRCWPSTTALSHVEAIAHVPRLSLAKLSLDPPKRRVR